MGKSTSACREESRYRILAMRCRLPACEQDLGNRAVSLVFDAKQRVVRNKYGIVALTMLAERQATTEARPRNRRRVQSRAQTAITQLLMQALVEGDSARNFADVLKLLSCKCANTSR